MRDTLMRFAVDGYPRSADAISELVEPCWDEGATTGDARWCFLADLFAQLAAVIENTEANGIPLAAARSIDEALGHWLPDVVDTLDPIDGTLAAATLRREVGRLVDEMFGR